MPGPDHPFANSNATCPPTAWTQVLAAGQGQADALEDLCRAYWPPAYAFFRHQGQAPPEAQDLVQSFFDRRVLRGQLLQGISPDQGRFRSWFYQSLRHHLHHARERAAAVRNGGAALHVPLDWPSFAEAEAQFQHSAASASPPETHFDREYAVTLIQRVYQRLADEYAQLGKAAWFTALAPYLTHTQERGDYARLATQLDTTEGALRVAANRLRNSFSEAIRNEILKTLRDPGELHDELQHLLRAWWQAGAPTP
ncbi:MAG: sigma-70 family RNA polymerase sigma factor [Verrucomicrobiae bacterium]|nr:sigma-70 family RNA polymerase sigma factor [Verrucomicrobiae bacterium]